MHANKSGGEKLTWTTPRWLYDIYDKQYNFELDAAASDENHLAPLYHNEETNGLVQPWAPLRTWCNPPYKRLDLWIEKAYKESLEGALCVLLTPVSTDTKWFYMASQKAAEIHFLVGRLKFGDGKQTAMFPSCVIIFDRTKEGTKLEWKDYR